MHNEFVMSKAFKWQKFFLTVTGTWPYKKEPFYYKLLSVSWAILFCIYLIILLIEVVLNLDNISKLATVLYLTMALVSYLFKYLAFVTNKQTVMDMLDLLNEDLFYQHDSKLNIHITKSIKVAKILTLMFIPPVFAFCTTYIFFPFLNGSNYPTPSSIDFGNLYVFIYLTQAAGIVHAGLNNGNFDVFCVTLLLLGSCQFDILKNKIMDIRKYAIEEVEKRTRLEMGKLNELEIIEEVDKIILGKLRNAVIHHNAIIK